MTRPADVRRVLDRLARWAARPTDALAQLWPCPRCGALALRPCTLAAGTIARAHSERQRIAGIARDGLDLESWRAVLRREPERVLAEASESGLYRRLCEIDAARRPFRAHDAQHQAEVIDLRAYRASRARRAAR